MDLHATPLEQLKEPTPSPKLDGGEGWEEDSMRPSAALQLNAASSEFTLTTTNRELAATQPQPARCFQDISCSSRLKCVSMFSPGPVGPELVIFI